MSHINLENIVFMYNLVNNYYPGMIISGSIAVYLLTGNINVLSERSDYDFIRNNFNSLFPVPIAGYDCNERTDGFGICRFCTYSNDQNKFDVGHIQFKENKVIDVPIYINDKCIGIVKVIYAKILLSWYRQYSDFLDEDKKTLNDLKILELEKLIKPDKHTTSQH